MWHQLAVKEPACLGHLENANLKYMKIFFLFQQSNELRRAEYMKARNLLGQRTRQETLLGEPRPDWLQVSLGATGDLGAKQKGTRVCLFETLFVMVISCFILCELSSNIWCQVFQDNYLHKLMYGDRSTPSIPLYIFLADWESRISTLGHTQFIYFSSVLFIVQILYVFITIIISFQVNLTGPTNPYEMSWHNMTNVGRLRWC